MDLYTLWAMALWALVYHVVSFDFLEFVWHPFYTFSFHFAPLESHKVLLCALFVLV